MGLVEQKIISNSPAGVPCKYLMFVMDHLTRYALFCTDSKQISHYSSKNPGRFNSVLHVKVGAS